MCSPVNHQYNSNSHIFQITSNLQIYPPYTDNLLNRESHCGNIYDGDDYSSDEEYLVENNEYNDESDTLDEYEDGVNIDSEYENDVDNENDYECENNYDNDYESEVEDESGSENESENEDENEIENKDDEIGYENNQNQDFSENHKNGRESEHDDENYNYNTNRFIQLIDTDREPQVKFDPSVETTLSENPNHYFGKGYCGMIGRNSVHLPTSRNFEMKFDKAPITANGTYVVIDGTETFQLNSEQQSEDLDSIPVFIEIQRQPLHFIACWFTNFFCSSLVNTEYDTSQWGKIIAAIRNDLLRALGGQPSFITEAPRSYWLIRNSLVPRQYGFIRYLIIDNDTLPYMTPATQGMYIGNRSDRSFVTGNNVIPGANYVLTSDIVFSASESYELLRNVLELMKSKMPIIPNHGLYACPWAAIDVIEPVITAHCSTYHFGVCQRGSSTSSYAVDRRPLTYHHDVGPMDAVIGSLGIYTTEGTTTTTSNILVDGIFATSIRKHGSPAMVLGHMIYCDVNKLPMYAYTYDIIYAPITIDNMVTGYLNLVDYIFTNKIGTTTSSTVQEHASFAYMVILNWASRWAYATPIYSSIGNTGYLMDSYHVNVFNLFDQSINDFIFPAYILEMLYRISPAIVDVHGDYNKVSKAIYYPTMRFLNLHEPGRYLSASFNSFPADPSPNHYWTDWRQQFGYWTLADDSGIIDDYRKMISFTPFLQMPKVESKKLLTLTFDISTSTETYRACAIKPTDEDYFDSDDSIRPFIYCTREMRPSTRCSFNLPYIKRRPQNYRSGLIVESNYGISQWVLDDTKSLNPNIIIRLDQYSKTQGFTSKLNARSGKKHYYDPKFVEEIIVRKIVQRLLLEKRNQSNKM